jgi:hypothetical protein
VIEVEERVKIIKKDEIVEDYVLGLSGEKIEVIQKLDKEKVREQLKVYQLY